MSFSTEDKSLWFDRLFGDRKDDVQIQKQRNGGAGETGEGHREEGEGWPCREKLINDKQMTEPISISVISVLKKVVFTPCL